MTIKCGPFNAVNYDRAWKAEDFATYFSSFIGDGVYPNPSTNLQVIEGDNMTTVVKPGLGWINGRIFINDSDYVLQHDIADGILKRIDRVVFRLNYLNRDGEIVIKKGTPASNPVAPLLQRDADMYELALADVLINNGATQIYQANITDLRLNSELCGIVHGTINQVDTTTIFNQYMAWFQQVTGSTEQELANWEQQMKQDFLDWFNSLQDILDDDAAANLANRITDLDQRFTAHQADLSSLEVGKGASLIGVHDTDGLFTSTDVNGALIEAITKANEAFTLGNSRKQELVDELLPLDPSLPISHESTWEEILTAMGQISTGKKFKTGTFTNIDSGDSCSFFINIGDFVPRRIIVSYRAEDYYQGYQHHWLEVYDADTPMYKLAQGTFTDGAKVISNGAGYDAQNIARTRSGNITVGGRGFTVKTETRFWRLTGHWFAVE